MDNILFTSKPASKWEKKRLMNFTLNVSQKFRVIVFDGLLYPGPVSAFVCYARLAHVITCPH